MLDLQWSTIVFQIVNFLILLVVLTRFLYQPVVRTMQQRQDAITARLREADERTAQADSDRAELARALEDARAQAEEIVATARAEAAAECARLVETARVDAGRYRDEAQRAMQEEEREELLRLAARIRETAAHVAGSLIRQAAGPAVHAALVERLISEGIHANGALPPGPGRPRPAIVVELAYAPEVDLQDRLRASVADPMADVAFRVNADLLAGARVLVGQHTVVDLSLQRALVDLQAEPVT